MLISNDRRMFKTLRISLTNSCNLSCTYCVPSVVKKDDVIKNNDRPRQKTVDELVSAVSTLHRILDLSTVRLTGGEPLLYKDLDQLIIGLKLLNIPNIRMTTNGVLLKAKVRSLKDAGIQGINVSLDALDEPVSLVISQKNKLTNILAGIEEALSLDVPVKINMVVLKGVNDGQILPLFDYSKARGIQIRFLELMSMGHLYSPPGGEGSINKTAFFGEREILALLATRFSFSEVPRVSSATARTWVTDDGYIFGVIANESSPFCHDCNRLRMDSEGKLYGCLSSNIPIQTYETDSEARWNQNLNLALSHKQAEKFMGSSISMIQVGG